MDNIMIFIIAFISPLIYWRVFFFINPGYFDKPFTRTKTGLQVHHEHYGILFVLIGSIVLLFTGENNVVVALLGFGLGSILDGMISNLLMPGNRPLELEMYRGSLSKTIYLFLAIISIIIIISFL